jgi:hypothetical protein
MSISRLLARQSDWLLVGYTPGANNGFAGRLTNGLDSLCHQALKPQAGGCYIG